MKSGYAQITEHLFDRDALIVEDRQASVVSLCTPDKKPYLTVSFDAPLFGLWSPAGKGAPFICIEPWYGTDSHNAKLPNNTKATVTIEATLP